MKKRKKPRLCEKCGKEEATSFSFFPGETGEYRWQICGSCNSDTERYYILIEDFFQNEERALFWLRQLSAKTWMDWDAFWKMLNRYEYQGFNIQINDQRDQKKKRNEVRGILDFYVKAINDDSEEKVS